MGYNRNKLWDTLSWQIKIKGDKNLMNKGELIKAAANKAGFTVKQTTEVYDALLETITEALKEGEKVQIVGLGTIEVKEVAAKTGINPKTKEAVAIPASKKPVMKFGKAYKDLFN